MGQLIYLGSGRKYLQYPEEKPGFEIPDKFKPKEKGGRRSNSVNNRAPNGEKPKRSAQQGARDASDSNEARPSEGERRSSDETIVDREQGEEAQGENQEGGEGEDDAVIVDWYGPDDPENPQNW